MQSCSNEFVVKFSKPKISKIPINWVMSLPRMKNTTLIIGSVVVFEKIYNQVKVGVGCWRWWRWVYN